MKSHLKMKYFIISACLLSLLVCAFALPEERVTGGEVAKEGQFPFAVSLEKHGKHSCGGSIINSRWILTAAHCIKTHAVEDLAILAGTLNRTSGGIRYQVERAIMHDKVWDADNFGNDIGLIKVAEEIEFTEKIQPIGLHLEHIEPDMWLTLCGWGRTHEDGHSVEDLHYIDLKIIDRKTCQSMHKHEIKNYMMCTLTKKGEGSCKGDSGSPLLLDGRIAGISSWGKKCGHGSPNVYTRVEYFVEWVYKTMEENS